MPVSFSDRELRNRSDLDQRILERLQDNQKYLGVTCSHEGLPFCKNFPYKAPPHP